MKIKEKTQKKGKTKKLEKYLQKSEVKTQRLFKKTLYII